MIQLNLLGIYSKIGCRVSFESGFSKIGRTLDAVYRRSIVFFRIVSKNSTSSKTNHHSTISPYFVLFFDSFIAFLSIFLSIHLRIGMDFLDYSPLYILENMLVFGLVSASVFLWFQTYQSFWKYTSIEDVVPVFMSVVISNIIFFPLMMLMNQEDFLPHSVLIINTFVLTIILLIPRFTAKILYNNKMTKIKKLETLTQASDKTSEVPSALLIGTSSSVDMFLNEMVVDDEIPFYFDPLGILSIDKEEVGRAVRGIPIIGYVKQLNGIIRNLSNEGITLKQIFITEKSIPDNMKKFLISCAHDHGTMLMHVIHNCTFNSVTDDSVQFERRV
jgi:O-antigen biosynthesis protein WbqV